MRQRMDYGECYGSLYPRIAYFHAEFLVAEVRMGPTGPAIKSVFGRGKPHEWSALCMSW